MSNSPWSSSPSARQRALDKLKQLPRDQLLKQPVSALGLNRPEMLRVTALVEFKRQKSLQTEFPAFISIGEMAESLNAQAYSRGRGIGEKRVQQMASLLQELGMELAGYREFLDAKTRRQRRSGQIGETLKSDQTELPLLLCFQAGWEGRRRFWNPSRKPLRGICFRANWRRFRK
jgi:hypothetical protein